VRSPVIWLTAVAFAVSGCGSSSAQQKTYHGIYVQNLPKQTTFRLNWVEPVHYGSLKLATFRVKELRVGPHGWTASVSFSNDSKQTFRLPTGGTRSPRNWGLGVFTDEFSSRIEDPGNYVIKCKVAPALPKALLPGESWSGTFSSPTPPRSRRVVRVLFGTFFWEGKPPPGPLGPFFVWLTTDFVHAPEPQGTAATATS